ncbi:MAG TPA: hypothetical protein VN682_23450 [Terriglobales bacterium]|nr:hypothetical protein [Terriglobales bacterium]
MVVDIQHENEAVASTVKEAKPAKRDAGAHLDSQRLQNLHRYWQAANYLTNGQIYPQENPLLRERLRTEHIKPRLLGHWGTSPGSQLYICPSEPAWKPCGDPVTRRPGR